MEEEKTIQKTEQEQLIASLKTKVQVEESRNIIWKHKFDMLMEMHVDMLEKLIEK